MKQLLFILLLSQCVLTPPNKKGKKRKRDTCDNPLNPEARRFKAYFTPNVFHAKAYFFKNTSSLRPSYAMTVFIKFWSL